MFVLKPNPTFTSKVSIPTADGPGEIEFVFKHKGRKALADFIQSITEPTKGKDTRTDLDALMEIVAGWNEVDTPFSKDALEELLDAYPGSASAIFNRYLPALTEGQEKNSGK